jgi:hypothetical protein
MTPEMFFLSLSRVLVEIFDAGWWLLLTLRSLLTHFKSVSAVVVAPVTIHASVGTAEEFQAVGVASLTERAPTNGCRFVGKGR